MGLFEKKYCDLCGDKVNALKAKAFRRLSLQRLQAQAQFAFIRLEKQNISRC